MVQYKEIFLEVCWEVTQGIKQISGTLLIRPSFGDGRRERLEDKSGTPVALPLPPFTQPHP